MTIQHPFIDGILYFFSIYDKIGLFLKNKTNKQKRGKHMKVCNTCGATMNDNASFCTKCGSSVPAVAAPQYRQPVYQAPAKEPISVGGWIGRSLIPLIPLVGGIVYFIMLCIWCGDTHKEDTFRNWAKAQLIVMAIVIVLSILGVICFAAFAEEMMYSLM